MDIGGISGSMVGGQLYQPQEQKIGGQVVQQVRPVQQQGPPEESKESVAAVQGREVGTEGGTPETRSIDLYA
ncbi:MAG: hypothetical protein LBD10_07110 [Desulfobulbus sp.]|jgi:hypothetical protein|uniref:hypothetical protein n=1 Tax=Desulfobulbus sp. TaxID=895 RepID=UPI00284D2D43|nr:hypothetical protein [Desulfobulbus sp.]MDR2549949.1 hypothetical protein [Desulfobulbus sp.]